MSINASRIADLLLAPAFPGYPDGYLLARVGARRAGMVRGWTTLASDDTALERTIHQRYPASRGAEERTAGDVWAGLLREYRWTYDQMNERLREIFRPYFLYTELRTIFIFLRYLKDERRKMIDDVLAASMLANPLKKRLKKATDVLSAAAHLEQAFSTLSDRFRGIAAVFKSGGLREFEHEMVNRYLETLLQADLHPVVRQFFSMIIDARNSVATLRYLTQDDGEAHFTLPGGRAPRERMSLLLGRKDGAGLVSLIGRTTGVQVDAGNPAGVEIAFYRAISRELQRCRREDHRTGAILHYLWGRSVEAMNLSTLLYGKDLDRDFVLAELVI